MSEQVQYASGGDSATNKRKYETDQSPPPPSSGGRRSTGFSAPISSQSPDSAPSYNSVPLPDEIELAKQRAQEIAARLYNTAEAKRPRVENGGYDSGDAKGFSLGPTDYGQKPIMNAVASVPAYGFPGPSKKIEIPNGRVGVIIGKQGETIKYLQLQSGAKIQVTRDSDADPNSPNREVELTGTPDQIAKAEQLINNVLKEAETGGSGTVSRRVTGLQFGEEKFVTKIPNNKVGLIIGKGGETIKSMQNNTGARIQVIPLHLPPGDTSTERTLQIDGTSEQIDAAKVLVNEIISENRLRNTRMGYSQQGYQSQPPPASWGPPPGQQQTGYGGYGQPGYPGQTPQYNMPQPQYPGYPPQPAPGGYATTGWDQTTNQQQQTTQGGGGYDYYNQQQPQQTPGGGSGPADNSAAYGYNQQAASGYNQQGQHQGYTQDAYGGYQQPGYGQPPSGYDQQQQGYNVANPTPEGQPPSSYGAPPPQGDNTGNNQAPQPTTTVGGPQGYNNPTSQQQPSPNPSYPPTQPGGYGMPPPTSQTGYGTQPPSAYLPGYGAPPPAQKPAAYGQPPQQSPTGQAGYGQPSPVQPGYPTQAGYGSAPASGYGPPPYGTQPSYGGQQPPAYNSPYGSGGYSQPPPAAAGYSAADGNGAPPAAASQAVPPPSGVAKASPQG